MFESIIENVHLFNGRFQTRWTTKPSIDDAIFNTAIASLGGYVYNVCCGVIGDISIFNGITWIGIGNNESLDVNLEWAEKFKSAYDSAFKEMKS